MIQASELLSNLTPTQIFGTTSIQVCDLCSDSRKIKPRAAYVALRGVNSDGHNYIDTAIQAGAVMIVAEELPTLLDPKILYVQVKDSSQALGEIAAAFYGFPTKQLKLIGITGTNGKTSVATLMHQTLKNLGHPAALISTVEYRIADQVTPSTHTTPDVIRINQILKQAVDAGCEYACMEVSSHGINQKRIAGLDFVAAGFTNLSHDHLDYHKTFSEYIKAKKAFFDQLPPLAIAITNADDRNGAIMLQNTSARQKTYALKTLADYHARILEANMNGMKLEINRKEVWTHLTGNFNAYNILLVFALLSELNFKEEEILLALSKLNRVRGRFETFKSPGGIFFIIDYAHTPDALENVLDTINSLRTRNERLITVFGCGGDRDATKRPEMGRIATSKSSVAILTSDNPRSEDPEKILDDIQLGISPEFSSHYLRVTDRKEAIRMAIKFAEPNDIVLVAGKGHETYQEINGVRHNFDDTFTIYNLLREMCK